MMFSSNHAYADICNVLKPCGHTNNKNCEHVINCKKQKKGVKVSVFVLHVIKAL